MSISMEWRCPFCKAKAVPYRQQAGKVQVQEWPSSHKSTEDIRAIRFLCVACHFFFLNIEYRGDKTNCIGKKE